MVWCFIVNIVVADDNNPQKSAYNPLVRQLQSFWTE